MDSFLVRSTCRPQHQHLRSQGPHAVCHLRSAHQVVDELQAAPAQPTDTRCNRGDNLPRRAAYPQSTDTPGSSVCLTGAWPRDPVMLASLGLLPTHCLCVFDHTCLTDHRFDRTPWSPHGPRGCYHLWRQGQGDRQDCCPGGCWCDHQQVACTAGHNDEKGHAGQGARVAYCQGRQGGLLVVGELGCRWGQAA